MGPAIRFDAVAKKFTLKKERGRYIQEVAQKTALDLLRRRLRWQGNEEQEVFWALQDVSFEVDPGETVGLVGSNGAGKSTALKLASRILVPDAGKVEINGKVGGLLELGAGFHPDLTGRENIYLNGSILGLSRSRIREKLDEIIAFAELERFIDTPVKHYSSGMYVRLGFSVAVHTEPEILLVDEVLAVGDQNFRRKCMDRIYDMKRSGITIFLVSHSIETVARLCSRAIWLEEGRVVQDGSARDVVESYMVEINEKDMMRLQEGSGTVPSSSKDATPQRSGSGEIQILDVAFLNVDGYSSEVFRPGNPMTVRLFYEATQRVEHPVFGIGIHRDDNVHVSGPNTSTSGYHISSVEGRGALDFTIPCLPLMAGRYEVSTSAYDETITHKYDYLHRAFSFSVQPSSPWDELGVLRLDGQWSLRPDKTEFRTY